MNASNVNPFVRFAGNARIARYPLVCYDTRIIYAIKGETELWVNGKSYTFKKGNLALLKSGTKYCIKNTYSANLILITFDYTHSNTSIETAIIPDLPQDFKKENITEIVYFDEPKAFNDVVILENADSIEDRILRIVDEFMTQKIYYRDRISGVLKDILFYVARHISIKSERPQSTADLIISYIKDNYATKITHKDISNLTNYNENYINTIMKQYTGKTLNQYIINYRILMSKDLLITTNYSISQISEMVGFNYTSHFLSAFRKITDTTPHKYRKQNNI